LKPNGWIKNWEKMIRKIKCFILIMLSLFLTLYFGISFAESRSYFRDRDYNSLSDKEKVELERQLYDVNNYSSDMEISGKLLNMDGSLYLEAAKICIKANILENWDFNQGGPPVPQSREEKFETQSHNGLFSWKGRASEIIIGAEVDGYHSTVDSTFCEAPSAVIKKDTLAIYLIPKGIPSKLEYIENAEIKVKKNEKTYGWSFEKKWYYAEDEDDTVCMTVSFDEKGVPTYTMKEPGGFVYFAGCPEPYTVYSRRYWMDFSFMTKAPESGYIPVFTLKNHRIPQTTDQVFCYFKTPDGKYGKMVFTGIGNRFSYYINPDGSRNLEAGEVEKVGPVNPDYQEWLDKWDR